MIDLKKQVCAFEGCDRPASITVSDFVDAKSACVRHHWAMNKFECEVRSTGGLLRLTPERAREIHDWASKQAWWEKIE